MPKSDGIFNVELTAAYSIEVGEMIISGDERTASTELVRLFNRISSNFSSLSQSQQQAYTQVFAKMTKCRAYSDFLGLADYLRFVLPYILTHSDGEFDGHL